MQMFRSALIALKAISKPTPFTWTPPKPAGVGCDLALRRRVASYRPATGYMEAGDKFFAWLVAVPEGAVTGTLSADGVTRQVTGSETPIRALIEWRHNDK